MTVIKERVAGIILKLSFKGFFGSLDMSVHGFSDNINIRKSLYGAVFSKSANRGNKETLKDKIINSVKKEFKKPINGMWAA